MKKMKKYIKEHTFPVICICDISPLLLCLCTFYMGVWSWFLLLALQIALGVLTYRRSDRMSRYVLSYVILFLSTVLGQILSMLLYLHCISSDVKALFIGGYGVLAGALTVLLLGTVPGWFFRNKIRGQNIKKRKK